jgi:putative FmdB family regulatory protein
MPYYSFACETCDTHFDIRATIAEKAAGLRPSCPTCGAHAVRQVITSPVTLTSLSATTRSDANVGGCGCGPGKPCR